MSANGKEEDAGASKWTLVATNEPQLSVLPVCLWASSALGGNGSFRKQVLVKVCGLTAWVREGNDVPVPKVTGVH